MKLLTRKLEKRFEQIGCQDGKDLDAIIIVKFFAPVGSWAWFATEYNPENQVFFGFVIGAFPELGPFSLKEFHEFNEQAKRNRKRLGLGIERDMHGDEKTLREHLKHHYRKVLRKEPTHFIYSG